MIAYKFLSVGAIAPFSGYRWPCPGPGVPGAWVEAGGQRLDQGIHACRVVDLAFWLDAELWRVELADPVAEGQRQVIGTRGRLLDRVPGWNDAAARDFAGACLWRARDRSVGALRKASLPEEAELLAGSSELSVLRAVASSLAPRRGLAAALAGYLAEAVDFLLAGDSACSAYISARSAVVAEGGTESEFGAERESQSSMLAEQLGL